MYAKWVEKDQRFAFSITDNGGNKITKACHQELLHCESQGKELRPDSHGKPVAIEPEPPSIQQLTKAAMARINAGYTQALASILDQYPNVETLSFDKQELEARTWQADNTAATPYLDAMLAERPLSKSELVTRILAKADAFMIAHGNATGRRQYLEDQVKSAAAAEDRATLNSLNW